MEDNSNNGRLIIRIVSKSTGARLEEGNNCELPSKCQNIIHGYALPETGQKNEEKVCDPSNSSNSCNPQNSSKSCNEVLVVNGSWDTTNKIPNIVAEMHNVHSEEINGLQNTGFEPRDFLNPSPRGSDSEVESDCTDRNLSWLLNYKIHELPPVPGRNAVQGADHLCTIADNDDGNSFQIKNQSTEQITQSSYTSPEEEALNMELQAAAACIFGESYNPFQRNDEDKEQDKEQEFIDIVDIQNLLEETSSENLANFESLIENSDIIITDNNEFACSELPRVVDPTSSNGQLYPYASLKKPPFTYTELIEHALLERGELTVSGIYQWISDHFPFYKQNDDRWKNSVRHNLSINPHFRKGDKAVHGAGHLWTIAQKDEKRTYQINQRMQEFIKSTYASPEEALTRELKAATASILGEPYNEFQVNDENNKQDIELEYIDMARMQNGLQDFLTPPVSKQQIVQECGLNSDVLITDLNQQNLSLNLSDGDVIYDGNIYEDIAFEYCDLEKE